MILRLKDCLGREYKVNAVRCRRPKFSIRFGRTWDRVSMSIDYVNLEGWLDTTWGRYVYFWYNGFWYKFKVPYDILINYRFPISLFTKLKLQ